MTPGVPSVCPGTVWHQRHASADHGFEYRVSMVWIDPDRPGDLTNHHRLWSCAEPAPARFRRRDYGDERTPPLGLLVRDDLEAVLGHRPDGPVRMLTQIRRLGWLFNPITVFLAWDAHVDEPVGCVLEVTNTPWKERHRYVVGLTRAVDDPDTLVAEFDKVLHVSPFLGRHHRYRLRIATGRHLRLELDVVEHTDRPNLSQRSPATVLSTGLELERIPASTRALRRSLLGSPLSTIRVSLGIHAQAARLAAKRVPFVPHPSKAVKESPA